jgi:hypothetical protein
MTLLVGMIGRDGIVLAADQSRTLQAESENTFDDQMLGRKIFHLEQHGISYAVAGDELTDEIGYKMHKYLDEGGLRLSNISECLQKMVDQAVTEIRKESVVPKEVTERTILMVFHGSQLTVPQLWRLRISPSITAKQVTGITVAGGIGNSARFFENYFQPNLPVGRLALLAAHIILTGGHIVPTMVKGLDIVFFQDGVRFLSENEKDQLRRESQELDALIRAQLLGVAP